MSGNVVDTNSAWIADKCWMFGHKVVWHGGVGDYLEEIGDACRLAASRADVVFVTGGLGATLDDITLEAAAKAFKKQMVFHEDIWRDIQTFFRKFGRECSGNNKRQAYIPEGGKPLTNRVGTAPGVQVKLGHAIFFFLPGVPRELYQIFRDSIMPWLKGRAEAAYEQKFLRCFGLPEASYDEKLKGLDLGPVRMSFRVTFPEVKIKLVARGKTALQDIKRAEEKIRKKIGRYIFGADDETLEMAVAELLKSSGLKLALAESCTGGHISNLLTNVPGASEWFRGGVVSYSNDLKTGIVGVRPATLKKHGAVSKACAEEMAKGIRKVALADIGLAVTGIAGPTGGTKEKPVGTVHIALATKGKTGHITFSQERGRIAFKQFVAYEALSLLRRHLT